jgi:hypothetical protein
MARHRTLISALGALVLAACSAAAEGPPASTTVASTVETTEVETTSGSSESSAAPTVPGVGNLPGPLPTEAPEEIKSTTTLPPPEEEVGALAAGNRILMLGDSILASTARRYSNNMCATLVPLGWQVQLEAEVSRGIDFGQRVQRELKDQHWDVGLIFLGNNYNDNQQDFFKRYNEVIVGFGDVPVIVATVTEFQSSQAEVNEIINALAGAHPNVKVLDWATISQGDGVIAQHDALKLHLTDDGRQVLADAVANVLGVAPTQPGDCLDSRHRDDSAGSVNGSTGNGKPPTSTVRPTQTTAKPTTSSTPTTTSPPTGCQIPPCPTSPPNTTAPPPASTAAPPPATTAPPPPATTAAPPTAPTTTVPGP